MYKFYSSHLQPQNRFITIYGQSNTGSPVSVTNWLTVTMAYYTVSQKNGPLLFFTVALANVGRFFKFFQCRNQKEMAHNKNQKFQAKHDKEGDKKVDKVKTIIKFKDYVPSVLPSHKHKHGGTITIDSWTHSIQHIIGLQVWSSQQRYQASEANDFYITTTLSNQYCNEYTLNPLTPTVATWIQLS